jgi:hypothetical protein
MVISSSITVVSYGPDVVPHHAADALAACVSSRSIVNSTPVILGFSARYTLRVFSDIATSPVDDTDIKFSTKMVQQKTDPTSIRVF